MDLAGTGVVLLLTAMASGLAATAHSDGTERTLTRVRGADTEMHRLILEGDRRSVSFRELVDEIHQSNVVVIVGFGLCAQGRFRSCVSHVAGDEQQRHIRILVNSRTTGDRLIATIGHELHHAVEIVRQSSARDTESVLALYRRIGAGKCRQGLSEVCETAAAKSTEKRVLQELYDDGKRVTSAAKQ